MELTKEYFDQQLKKLTTKTDLADEREHSDTKFNAMFEGFKSINDSLNLVAKDVKSIKEDLKELSKRDLEDSNAFAKDIVELEKRILKIEKRLKLTT
jgi:hypothetical protein